MIPMQLQKYGDYHHKCAQILSPLVSTLPPRNSLFVGCTKVAIVPGSYLLSMPTQNGRSALVIFPPGEQSLDDIDMMLGDEGREGKDVLELHRASVVDGDDGFGCNLFCRNV